ncbi:response regulator transcription factor [Nocardia fluminea]|uniref:response regulator transcription factor n=1 Tax=Nocardia fluminea TaxID=134984 RepID=UPI0033CF2771
MTVTTDIRVLLVDDQALLRGTFRLLLDAAPGIEVIAEAGTGVAALAALAENGADVVLMDIRMPEMDGIEATRRITGDPAHDQVKILVLTTFEDDDLILAALRAGASGFLGKGVTPHHLIEAIRTVAEGDQLLSPAATRALVQRLIDQPDQVAAAPVTHPGLDRLTDREREMVRWVATGLSNEQIAERLVISPATVKTHVNRAMAKTHSRDRAQLVVLAYEIGLAAPGHDPGR